MAHTEARASRKLHHLIALLNCMRSDDRDTRNMATADPPPCGGWPSHLFLHGCLHDGGLVDSLHADVNGRPGIARRPSSSNVQRRTSSLLRHPSFISRRRRPPLLHCRLPAAFQCGKISEEWVIAIPCEAPPPPSVLILPVCSAHRVPSEPEREGPVTYSTGVFRGRGSQQAVKRSLGRRHKRVTRA